MQGKPCREPDYCLEVMDGEILLFHPSEEKILYCNETASLIWQLCDGQRTPQEIETLLLEAFPEAAGRMHEDVAATLDRFLQQEVITFA